jgi:hypothetical protein
MQQAPHARRHPVRTRAWLLTAVLALAPFRMPAQVISVSPSDLPLVVTAPGRYVLAADATVKKPGVSGIHVNADDVVIDLGGHALRGAGPRSGDAIVQAAPARRLTVQNGRIEDWGGSPVRVPGAGNRIGNVTVRRCGQGVLIGPDGLVSNSSFSKMPGGLVAGARSVLSDITVYEIEGGGIELGEACSLARCNASDCGTGIRAARRTALHMTTCYRNRGAGIEAGEDGRLTVCVAYENGAGIRAGTNVFLGTCTAYENEEAGLEAGLNCGLSNSVAYGNGGDGVRVQEGCRVYGGAFYNNHGAGIRAAGGGNRIERTLVKNNGEGIRTETEGNTVAGNRAGGNAGGNYLLIGGDAAGHIVFGAENTPFLNPQENLEF